MTDAFGIPSGLGGSERQSRAMYEAATNLLDKAVRALGDGQADRALGYVRKAGSLPYDDHDAASPLALAAHMRALRSVLDAHEVGHRVWIDAANILVDPMPTRKSLAVADFRHVLTVVQHDFATSAAEERQVRALIAGQQVATIQEMQDLAGEELCAVVIDLLRIVIEYDRRVEAITDGRGTGGY